MLNLIKLLAFSILLFGNALYAQGQFSGSIVRPSPDEKKVIVTDAYEAPENSYRYSSFLYALPLNLENRIQLKSDPNYKWSTHGRYFFTDRPNNVEEGGPPSRILIFNSEGDSVRTIENGVAIDEGLSYYLRDTDENGKLIAPRLMRYDIERDVSKEVVVFPDSLTLWGIAYPDYLCSPQYPVDLCGGKMVVLFQRRGEHDARTRQVYTFFIYLGEILMSRQGHLVDVHSFKAEACKMVYDRMMELQEK